MEAAWCSGEDGRQMGVEVISLILGSLL